MMHYQMYPAYDHSEEGYSSSYTQRSSPRNSRHTSPSVNVDSDVTLIVDGERFPTSREILSNASPVFARTLSMDEHSDHLRRVHIKGIRPQIIELMLQFLHQGNISLCCANTALALLEPAQRYQIEPLSDYAEQFLLDSVDTEHYCEMYAFACERGLKSLKHAFRERIVEDFDEFSETSSFVKLEIRLVEELVQHAALLVNQEHDIEDQVDCEFELVDAISHWLRPGSFQSESRFVFDHSWGNQCEPCLMNGSHQLRIGHLYRGSQHETNREHYEERLFRQVDLSFFDTDDLMQLQELAESSDFDFLNEAIFYELEQRTLDNDDDDDGYIS